MLLDDVAKKAHNIITAVLPKVVKNRLAVAYDVGEAWHKVNELLDRSGLDRSQRKVVRDPELKRLEAEAGYKKTEVDRSVRMFNSGWKLRDLQKFAALQYKVIFEVLVGDGRELSKGRQEEVLDFLRSEQEADNTWIQDLVLSDAIPAARLYPADSMVDALERLSAARAAEAEAATLIDRTDVVSKPDEEEDQAQA